MAGKGDFASLRTGVFRAKAEHAVLLAARARVLPLRQRGKSGFPDWSRCLLRLSSIAFIIRFYPFCSLLVTFQSPEVEPPKLDVNCASSRLGSGNPTMSSSAPNTPTDSGKSCRPQASGHGSYRRWSRTRQIWRRTDWKQWSFTESVQRLDDPCLVAPITPHHARWEFHHHRRIWYAL